MWFAYACVWVSMAAVVIAAMFITRSWLPIWFMLIPALVQVSKVSDKKPPVE